MLFEISDDFEVIHPVPSVSFQEIPFREAMLNRMVRTQLSLLMREHLLVIACEVTRRQAPDTRIDIVALDTKARPIAIELKLQERGGSGDLQAIRGASVLADMTVEELCMMHGKYLKAEYGINEPAPAYSIERFLGRLPTTLGEPRMLVISNGLSPSMWRVLKLMQSKHINIGLVDLAVRKIGGKLHLDVTHLLCGADDTPRQTTVNDLQEVFHDLTMDDIQQECPDELARVQQQRRAGAMGPVQPLPFLPASMVPPPPDEPSLVASLGDDQITPQPPDEPQTSRRWNPFAMPVGYTECEVIKADSEVGPNRLRAWCPPDGHRYEQGSANRPLDVPPDWVLGVVTTAPQRSLALPSPLRAWCPPSVIKAGHPQPSMNMRRGREPQAAVAS